MNRTKVKQLLKATGYTGKTYFLKQQDFGKPNGGPWVPAVHHRVWNERDIDDIMYSVERDGFKMVVIYLEPKSYYEMCARLANPKHVWTEGEISSLRKNLGFCTNWSRAAADDLRAEIQRNGMPSFRITKQQSQFGIEWLNRTQFKLNGELRAGAFIGAREARIRWAPWAFSRCHMKIFKFKVIEYWLGGTKPERIIEVKAQTKASAIRKITQIQGNRDWEIVLVE